MSVVPTRFFCQMMDHQVHHLRELLCIHTVHWKNCTSFCLPCSQVGCCISAFISACFVVIIDFLPSEKMFCCMNQLVLNRDSYTQAPDLVWCNSMLCRISLCRIRFHGYATFISMFWSHQLESGARSSLYEKLELHLCPKQWNWVELLHKILSLEIKPCSSRWTYQDLEKGDAQQQQQQNLLHWRQSWSFSLSKRLAMVNQKHSLSYSVHNNSWKLLKLLETNKRESLLHFGAKAFCSRCVLLCHSFLCKQQDLDSDLCGFSAADLDWIQQISHNEHSTVFKSRFRKWR